MINTAVEKKGLIQKKAIVTLCAIAASIVLPQIFHWVGNICGLGGQLGATFLPMHLPVFMAGFLSGPIVGLITGLASPFLSYSISQMPAAPLLPFMVVELAVYGLTVGLMKNIKLPSVLKLIVAQIAGRAVKALAILVAVEIFSAKSIGLQAAYNTILVGLPGILLQLCLIPLLLYRIKQIKYTNSL